MFVHTCTCTNQIKRNHDILSTLQKMFTMDMWKIHVLLLWYKTYFVFQKWFGNKLCLGEPLLEKITTNLCNIIKNLNDVLTKKCFSRLMKKMYNVQCIWSLNFILENYKVWDYYIGPNIYHSEPKCLVFYSVVAEAFKIKSWPISSVWAYKCHLFHYFLLNRPCAKL